MNILSYIVLIIFSVSGIIAAYKLVQKNHYKVILILSSIIPLLAILLFPIETIKLEMQYSLWSISGSAIIASLVMYIFILFNETKKHNFKITIRVCCVTILLLMLYPMHTPHYGWGNHGHLLWESPYHLH